MRKKIRKLDIFFLTVIVLSTFLYFFPPRMWLMKWLQNRDVPVIEQVFTNDKPADPTIDNILKARYEDVGMQGQLIIPQEGVGIDLPILIGTGYYNMLIGAGEQIDRSDVKMGGYGNYILASHKTDWDNILFSNLRFTNVGSDIWLADEENVYVYRVTQSFETDVSHTEVLEQPDDPTTKMITLYTCREFDSPYRYVVQGELEQTIPLTKINKETKRAFDRWLTTLKEV